MLKNKWLAHNIIVANLKYMWMCQNTALLSVNCIFVFKLDIYNWNLLFFTIHTIPWRRLEAETLGSLVNSQRYSMLAFAYYIYTNWNVEYWADFKARLYGWCHQNVSNISEGSMFRLWPKWVSLLDISKQTLPPSTPELPEQNRDILLQISEFEERIKEDSEQTNVPH